MNGYGSEMDVSPPFSGKPLATNMVLCCTENLCGGTNTTPQGAHPLYRLSTASKRKIYQSEKRKVIGQTTVIRYFIFGQTLSAALGWAEDGLPMTAKARSSVIRARRGGLLGFLHTLPVLHATGQSFSESQPW